MRVAGTACGSAALSGGFIGGNRMVGATPGAPGNFLFPPRVLQTRAAGSGGGRAHGAEGSLLVATHRRRFCLGVLQGGCGGMPFASGKNHWNPYRGIRRRDPRGPLAGI